MIDYDAYDTLTRQLTNMHWTERDVLDTHVNYRDALNAVKAYQVKAAIAFVEDMRTAEGDAWRERVGLNFVRWQA